jgi:Trypsin-like peptidase domain/Tetratricopeptide repeat/Anaphase-promoting complex subunit 5
MAVDLARVAMVFATGPAGERVGSGYAVGERLVLTSAHVLSQAGLTVDDRAEVYLLGSGSWVPGTVAWLDPDLDAALVRADAAAPWPGTKMSVLRWGKLAGADSVLAAAIGFPWAQQRPDGVHDTEHAVGFVPPGAGAQTGSLHLSVLSSAPLPRPDGGSPWAGMSGAGLVVGPYLVGVVVVDPGRYGTDRLVVVPAARLLDNPAFAAALGKPIDAAPVGAGWRLEYATGRSVTLAPPYRPLPPGFDVAAARHQLLFPAYSVVPFAGREDLVAELAGWCTGRDRPGLAVRTITGGGGSGKTRLAAQVCLAVAGVGFDAGFVDVKSPGGAVQWLLDRPTLLVVDNADLNLTLVADLVAALAYTDVPVRLLLVARSRIPWWHSVQTMTEDLVDGFDDGDLALDEHTLDTAARAYHYRAAFEALSAALPALQRPHPTIPESPGMTAMAFGDPLMVHLAALLAASGEPFDPTQEPSGSVRTRVMRAFLEREAARWPTQVAAEEPAAIPPVVLRRCVAAATIAAPRHEASGAAALVAVPDLADSEAGRRLALARWLHTLNPGPDYWNPLRPDPLADQLLADLDVLPELALTLIEQAIAHTDHATMDRMLAELTRAAAAGAAAAATALDRTLHHRLGDLLDAALTKPEGPLPQRLTAALSQVPAPAAAAELVDRLPEYSLAMADLAETLTGQSVTHYRRLTTDDPARQSPNLANLLNKHSNWLAALGQREDALAASTEAVRIYRELAKTRPDAVRPDLAGSLNNYANWLAALGQREEALAAINEAVQIYRELAKTRPDAFHPLAGSLNNQCARLAALGQREDALAAITEAVQIRREQAAAFPEAFRPDLATSLTNQCTALAALNRFKEARAAINEAVHIYRQLAAASPDAFRRDLATSLTNQCTVLAALGRREDALTAITEAVQIRRELAAARPEAFRPDLAVSLNNQCARLAALNRFEESRAAITEAVQIYRELAAARPEVFRPELASSLINQSNTLAALNRREETQAAITDTVQIYRELATANPDAFRPELAGLLNNYSNWLAALGRFEEARAAITEAVQIHRELAAARPEVFRPALASSLTSLGITLAELRDFDAALSADTDAARIYATLYSINHEQYRDSLRQAVNNVEIRLRDLGRSEEEITSELHRLLSTDDN